MSARSGPSNGATPRFSQTVEQPPLLALASAPRAKSRPDPGYAPTASPAYRAADRRHLQKWPRASWRAAANPLVQVQTATHLGSPPSPPSAWPKPLRSGDQGSTEAWLAISTHSGPSERPGSLEGPAALPGWGSQSPQPGVTLLENMDSLVQLCWPELGQAEPGRKGGKCRHLQLSGARLESEICGESLPTPRLRAGSISVR